MFQAGFLHLHNCRSLSWLQVGLLGFAEVRERLRQLVLVIANTCGEKAGEITGVHGSCAGCWLHPWQNLLSLSAELVFEPQSFFMAAINRPFFSFLLYY